MIYTVTFNPSLDYVMHMDELCIGSINRSVLSNLRPGGKGINVSFVLTSLGVNCTALGFIAGFVGDEIKRSLENSGIKTDFITLKSGCSRINVKIRSDAETDINAEGPQIADADIRLLFQKLDRLNIGDYLVLAGSIPKTLPSDTYETIMKHLFGKGIKIVVDAEGELLIKTLSHTPFLIKPNLSELGGIFGEKIDSDDAVVNSALRLREMGAANVLVSMAERGSVLADETGAVTRLPACRGKVIDSVGAGDSMLAGFLAEYISSGSLEAAHKVGSAAGSATAFSEGLADAGAIKMLVDN